MREANLAAAYAAADEAARKAAKNFYPCFRILPREQREATVVLYAFLREIDDIADGSLPAEAKRRLLLEWKQAIQGDHQTTSQTQSLWAPAFNDVVERCELPVKLLEDAVDGVAWDLDYSARRNFAELYEYCYGVASTAGLLSIRLWGATDPAADLPAEWLGIAFQLTNILRDVAEDHRQGRCYLPSDDLNRFGVRREELAGPANRRLINLILFEADRARDYFTRGAEVKRYLPGPGRAVVHALVGVYRSLLDEIARNPAAVFERRLTASCWSKVKAILSALPDRFPGSVRPERAREQSPGQAAHRRAALGDDAIPIDQP